MKRSRTTQVIRVVSALAVPALVGVLALPGVASASALIPKGAAKGSCTSLSGNIDTTVNIAGCSPAAAGSSGGVFNFSANSTSGSSSISWSSGAVTTFSFGGKQVEPTKTNKKGVTSANKKFTCPTGDLIQFDLKGKVKSDTGLSGGNLGFKGAVKATVCVDQSDDVSLKAGTLFTL
jgi:hypothetical protein